MPRQGLSLKRINWLNDIIRLFKYFQFWVFDILNAHNVFIGHSRRLVEKSLLLRLLDHNLIQLKVHLIILLDLKIWAGRIDNVAKILLHDWGLWTFVAAFVVLRKINVALLWMICLAGISSNIQVILVTLCRLTYQKDIYLLLPFFSWQGDLHSSILERILRRYIPICQVPFLVPLLKLSQRIFLKSWLVYF